MKPYLFRLSVLAFALFLLAALSPAAAGQGAQINFDALKHLEAKADEVVDVTLDGDSLRFAGAFLSKNEPEEVAVRKLVHSLKGIYVKAYTFDADGQFTAADVESVRSQLRAPEWTRLVGVRSRKGGENVDIFMLLKGDVIEGMAIIAFEDRELAVINIVGPIDMEMLMDLEGHIGIPDLELEKDDHRSGSR
ncbi:MAG TPA: DUF4252 domain-containing protein [Acidobacteriota bacterium]|mgnify:FL=1|nr:DUF4252 domain-containing protein [Acidobacteriota bacterium]